MEKLEGCVKVGDVSTTVTFEPAPADERPPGETVGCSHFVAKTPFLDAGASAAITVTVVINGVESTASWPAFVPKNFAHHHD
jgi:hypothetical protein